MTAHSNKVEQKMVKVFNDNGYIWVVVYVAMNQWQHKVVFYDAQQEHCGNYGQFVADYYVDTILDSQGGLNLQGGVPEWTIGDSTMSRVRAWVAEVNEAVKC